MSLRGILCYWQINTPHNGLEHLPVTIVLHIFKYHALNIKKNVFFFFGFYILVLQDEFWTDAVAGSRSEMSGCWAAGMVGEGEGWCWCRA